MRGTLREGGESETHGGSPSPARLRCATPGDLSTQAGRGIISEGNTFPEDLIAEWIELKRLKVRLNIYPTVCFDSSSVCETRGEAGARVARNRIACIEIDCLEGDTLE